MCHKCVHVRLKTRRIKREYQSLKLLFLSNSEFIVSRVVVVDGRLTSSTIRMDGCHNTDNEVNYIEQVQIVLTIDSDYRGGLTVSLTSPSGTHMTLLPVIFVLYKIR
jgi:hypothetical protein